MLNKTPLGFTLNFCMSVVTGSGRAPLPAPVSFTGLAAFFNAPHMKLIRVSAHKGGPGSQRCGDRMDQGPFTVEETGAMSNLIKVGWSETMQVYKRYVAH